MNILTATTVARIGGEAIIEILVRRRRRYGDGAAFYLRGDDVKEPSFYTNYPPINAADG